MDQLRAARGQPARRQRRGRRRAGSDLHGAGARLHAQAAIVAVTGAELTPKVNGEPRPRNWTSFAVQGGRSAHLRFPEGGRARLHRGRRRHRRAGRARQPLDLCARRARRLRGPQARGRRRAAGRQLRSRCKRRPRARRPTCARPIRKLARAARAARPLLAPHHRRSAARRSSRTPGRSRRRPTASAIASARGGRSIFVASASSRSAPAPIRPTSSMPAIPTARSRCPAALEPIVLHRDAVSGGGYAMIGTVISADMDLIAQLQPQQSGAVRRGGHGRRAQGARRVQEPGGAADGVAAPVRSAVSQGLDRN